MQSNSYTTTASLEDAPCAIKRDLIHQKRPNLLPNNTPQHTQTHANTHNLSTRAPLDPPLWIVPNKALSLSMRTH